MSENKRSFRSRSSDAKKEHLGNNSNQRHVGEEKNYVTSESIKTKLRHSTREKSVRGRMVKLNEARSRRTERARGKSRYDDKGFHLDSKLDLCDCLNEECGGCFFPCPKCSSQKCGHECRTNRSWEYQSYEIEGTNVTIKNPNIKD